MQSGTAVLVIAVLYLRPMVLWSSEPALMALAVGSSAVLLILLAILTNKIKVAFEYDVKSENEARLRSTELLMSQVIETKPLVRFKRPLLFRRSGRLFRQSDDGTMLAEMRMKAFLRKIAYVRVWAGFISVSSYAVMLSPAPVAGALVFALAVLGSSWLQQQWKLWFEESFIKQFPWTDQAAQRGMSLSRFWLVLPGILIWSAIAGWKVGSAWQLIIPLLGLLIWMFVNRLVGPGSAAGTSGSM